MITNNFKKRIITSLILFFLIVLIIINKPILIYSLIVISVISMLEFFNMIKKIFENNLLKILINSTFACYVSLFSILFLFYSNFFQFKIILFSLLFGCIASDIGGYVFGKTFKGPKLTKISPKKTISGSIGSFIFCSLFFSISIFFFTNQFDFKILLIGVLTSLACQLGDILFSFVKRKAKLKDTGNLLPGHGGVLDRLDSILFGIPFGLITLIFFY